MFDIVGRRYLFFAVSLALIIPGLIALLIWGVKPSIDFTGGTVWEVVPNAGVTTEQFDSVLEQAGYPDAIVQTANLTAQGITTNTVVMRLRDLDPDAQQKVTTALITNNLVPGTINSDATAPGATATVTAGTEVTGTTGTTSSNRATFTEGHQIQFSTVGPAIGEEVERNAFLAVVVASLGIMGYLWYAFRRVPNALRYGVAAVLGLIHDALVVVGIFAILGELFGVEVDALFITALLTVIGFSVHDTIVVFDRIRENMIKRRFETFEKIVNYSLLQTIARSINTSLTVIFTLLALYLFGGVSIKSFVLALLIGIVSGTYSSIFNASLILVVWENKEWRNWFGRGKNATASETRARTA